MKLTEEQIETLKDLIDHALHCLYMQDYQLIEHGINEKSITFRFGWYFSQIIREFDDFSDLQVDAEYNRNLDRQKRTPSRPRGSAPDILLHQRMSHDRNILVIEFKGYWNTDEEDRNIDIHKLEDFTSLEEEYQYGLGAFIEINRYEPKISYYKNGSEI